MIKEEHIVILLVSDDVEIFNKVQALLEDKWEIIWCRYSEIAETNLMGDYIVIIEFNKEKMRNEKFGAIIQIKGYLGHLVPILAILPEKKPQDIFEVLRLGAYDYITQEDQECLEIKVKEIIRWKWFTGRGSK